MSKNLLHRKIIKQSAILVNQKTKAYISKEYNTWRSILSIKEIWVGNRHREMSRSINNILLKIKLTDNLPLESKNFKKHKFNIRTKIIWV